MGTTWSIASRVPGGEVGGLWRFAEPLAAGIQERVQDQAASTRTRAW